MIRGLRHRPCPPGGVRVTRAPERSTAMSATAPPPTHDRPAAPVTNPRRPSVEYSPYAAVIPRTATTSGNRSSTTARSASNPATSTRPTGGVLSFAGLYELWPARQSRGRPRTGGCGAPRSSPPMRAVPPARLSEVPSLRPWSSGYQPRQACKAHADRSWQRPRTGMRR